MRISQEALNGAFGRYVRAVESRGVSQEGYELTLFTGSKVNGKPFEVWWIRPGDRQRKRAPGGEFLGWTKAEAHHSLMLMARTLEDIWWSRENLDV